MIIAFTTYQGDVDRLIEQLHWCEKLGEQKDHDALIVADCGTDASKVQEARNIARRVFKSAIIVTNEKHTAGWVEGPRSLFVAASKYAANSGQPFLLMEPDAIPLKSGWLDTLAEAYERSGAQYMGHVYACNLPGSPESIMSGIGVYPPSVYELALKLCANQAWDVELAPALFGVARNTPLIFHFWGEKNRPPTFANEGVEGTEVFGLSRLPKYAVIFHRNKDGTLIHQLHRKLFPDEKRRPPITVVFPVCNRDIGLANRHAQWLRILQRGEQWTTHRALIAFDKSINMMALTVFQNHLREVFSDVQQFCYPEPAFPGWPAAPNWAFQHTAMHMAQQPRPWLWLEADAVVLDRAWLHKLQAEYEDCGRPFMGPHVQGMHHSNGVMVYPHDTPSRIPSAMRCIERAWDYECAGEMMPHCHNASRLLQHVWTIFGEQTSEVGGGQEPAGVTVDRARRWIRPGAVIIHRIKDDSLLQLLMRKEFTPDNL